MGQSVTCELILSSDPPLTVLKTLQFPRTKLVGFSNSKDETVCIVVCHVMVP